MAEGPQACQVPSHRGAGHRGSGHSLGIAFLPLLCGHILLFAPEISPKVVTTFLLRPPANPLPPRQDIILGRRLEEKKGREKARLAEGMAGRGSWGHQLVQRREAGPCASEAWDRGRVTGLNQGEKRQAEPLHGAPPPTPVLAPGGPACLGPGLGLSRPWGCRFLGWGLVEDGGVR